MKAGQRELVSYLVLTDSSLEMYAQGSFICARIGGRGGKQCLLVNDPVLQSFVLGQGSCLVWFLTLARWRQQERLGVQRQGSAKQSSSWGQTCWYLWTQMLQVQISIYPKQNNFLWELLRQWVGEAVRKPSVAWYSYCSFILTGMNLSDNRTFCWCLQCCTLLFCSFAPSFLASLILGYLSTHLLGYDSLLLKPEQILL